MRAVVTRVKEASVSIDDKVISGIGNGLLVLLGIKNSDTEKEAKWMADRICGLRIFEDNDGKINIHPYSFTFSVWLVKMNINPKDANAKILIVSQFTLYADVSSRRPGFSDAAGSKVALPLYEMVVEECRLRGFHVETGEFGADMQISSINDGPVTIIIESTDQK